MTFDKTFQLSSYLVLVAGFVAIATAGGVGFVIGLVYLALLGATWFLGPIEVSRKWQFVIVLILFLLFCFDFLVIGTFGTATVRLLLLLSLYKALLREKETDYLINYLISFSLLLIASTYTISILYLITLIVYFFFSVFTFVLFESRQSYARDREAEFSLGAFLKASAAITVLTMVLSIPIFLAIPRGSLGLFGMSDNNVSGFSSTVALGDIGRILRNPEVIMRVGVNSPVETLPLNLRWRGIALDYFDGRAWSNTQQVGFELEADPEGRFLVQTRRRQKESLLEQTYYLEPFSNVIFGAGSVVQLSGLNTRRTRIWQDTNSSLFVRPRPLEPIRYYVHSDIQERQDKIRAIREITIPAEFEGIYLQLPAVDPGVLELALDVGAAETSLVRKALRLESFLKERFTYTLENPSGGTPDPLADFLINSKAGHCEYFATSLAVMLRVQGIPSRVVNGFRRGEYNEWGDYFIVRQSDAHSWVEAYFPGAGWTEFDPTPPRLAVQRTSLIRMVGQLLDSLDVLWTEIITFDRFKQIGFFQSIRRSLRTSWNQMSHSFNSFFQADLPDLERSVEWLQPRRNLIFLLSAGILSSILVYRYRRYLRIFWRRRFLRGAGVDIAQEYYLELLEILERKGCKKSEFETPIEFAKRVRTELETDLPFQIVETYYRNRFGQYEVDEAELSVVYATLRELRR